VEDQSNRIVWEDRPVTIRFADEAQAASLPLRKEPTRGGVLRLIDIEDFDLSACGGTHVARTGAIGIIAVASWERFRGGTRVEFVCGVRALTAYRALRDVVTGSVRLISVLPNELPSGIKRLQTEAKDARRRIKGLQEQLAAFEAAALADRADERNGVRLVAAALEGWDPTGLKSIAGAIVERPGFVAALFGVPSPSSVVIARAAGVEVDCAAVLKALTGRFGGKGGGRPELAQGGGLAAPADALTALARATILGQP
jgi:alanyl-tRNA synthetase